MKMIVLIIHCTKYLERLIFILLDYENVLKTRKYSQFIVCSILVQYIVKYAAEC